MKAGEDFRTASGQVPDTVLLEGNCLAGAVPVSCILVYGAGDLIFLQGLIFFL